MQQIVCARKSERYLQQKPCAESSAMWISWEVCVGWIRGQVCTKISLSWIDVNFCPEMLVSVTSCTKQKLTGAKSLSLRLLSVLGIFNSCTGAFQRWGHRISLKCLNTVLEEQITDVSSEGMGKYFLTITEQNEIVHLWVKYSMEVEGSPVANENHKIVIFGKFHEGDDPKDTKFFLPDLLYYTDIFFCKVEINRLEDHTYALGC